MIKRPRWPNKWILIPSLLVILGIGIYSAKFIYDKLTEPDFYKPDGEVSFVSPANLLPKSQANTPKEPGSSALLPGAKWVPQTFNNCGPATTSMILQYFGFSVDQDETKARLRTNPDDKNVFTYEIADYLRSDYGIESKLLYGGDINLIKKLLANGFYVVIEDWLHSNEDIGHTTIIRGFDDEQGVFISDDSFIGVNITYPYQQFSETQWKPFNYEYLPVYKAESEELLKTIIGSSWNENPMYQKAAAMAQSEIDNNGNDVYAWFNLGSSRFGLGDYKGAKAAFEKAESIGWPKRMLWYQIQPIQTYNALGEYQKAIDLANQALAGNDSFSEAHLEKAIAYKGLGESSRAREEANTALSYAPNNKKVLDFLASL